MADVEKEPVSRQILLEEHIEEDLIANLGKLRPFGYDLKLYADPDDGRSGRQLICKGNGGRIDLLCYDSRNKRYVVIELKNVRAGQNTFAQISHYISWVQ